eukprot:4654457-Ditylum_brightwellii.AAC.1
MMGVAAATATVLSFAKTLLVLLGQVPDEHLQQYQQWQSQSRHLFFLLCLPGMYALFERVIKMIEYKEVIFADYTNTYHCSHFDNMRIF